jgi:hypothetical protein
MSEVTWRSTSNFGCWRHTDTVAAASLSAEVELDDSAARGKALPVNPPPHPPEENDGVQLARSRIAESPARAPPAQDVDDPLELAAGAGGRVLDSAAVGTGAPLDDPHSLKPPEPLDEKRTGDTGKPTVQVVEVPQAREELSDDQRCPAVGENLRRSGHRAVLAVQVHGAHLPGDAGSSVR